MRPTRRTQPFRKRLARPAGPTLQAMLAGRPKYRTNPMDVRRKTAKRRRT